MLNSDQKDRLQTLHSYEWVDQDIESQSKTNLNELLGKIDSIEELWYASFIIQWSPEEGDLECSEIGYVPQFSIAYEELTVEENIESTVRLRAKTENRKEFEELVDGILNSTGLDPLRDRVARQPGPGDRIPQEAGGGLRLCVRLRFAAAQRPPARGAR